MNRTYAFISFFFIATSVAPSVLLAQTDTGIVTGNPNPTLTEHPLPMASNGGKAELLAPQPVVETADPVNQVTTAETVNGLILTVTIDDASITLDSAIPSRIPRRLSRADRAVDGDSVKATALAGGQVIATTVVPDTVLNASEGDGLVRTPRRQVTFVFATEHPVDTVTIEASATGARTSLDVKHAYATICDKERKSKWCPQR